MKTSDTINELATALAKAQSEVEGAHKSSDNPFFKSKYADLASVWDACRDPLTKNGLAVVQHPATEILDYSFKDDKGNDASGSYARVTLVTRLIHSSGQWIEGSVVAEAKDAAPQSIGSAITYLRRYALQSMVGVAPEDDDGNTAGKPPAARVQHKPATNGVPAEAFQSAQFTEFALWIRKQIPDKFADRKEAWEAAKVAAALHGHNETSLKAVNLASVFEKVKHDMLAALEPQPV